MLVATVRVPSLSPTKKLVHGKWIAFAICLFLNGLFLKDYGGLFVKMKMCIPVKNIFTFGNYHYFDVILVILRESKSHTEMLQPDVTSFINHST